MNRVKKMGSRARQIERDAKISLISAQLADTERKLVAQTQATLAKEHDIEALLSELKELKRQVDDMVTVREGGPFVGYEVPGTREVIVRHTVTYEIHSWTMTDEQRLRTLFSTASIAIKLHAEKTLGLIRQSCGGLRVSARIDVTKEELIQG